MAGYSQANRALRIDTTLGEDVLLPTGFTGTEGVSVPFAFRVDLVSTDPAIAAEKLLRTPVCLTVALADGGERTIHGLVRRFVQLGQQEELTAYQADVVPWLWFLSLSQDCRIFQNLSTLDIVSEVFRTYGYKDFKVKCTRSYPEREYCVQYRETHLDFISRLLEEEGIFYYFEHSATGHTLVLADNGGAIERCPGTGGGVRVSAQASPTEEVVTHLRQEHAVHAGTVTLSHYDYLQPALDLASSISGDGREEIYDYPGKHTTRDAGERLARLRLEAAEATRQVLMGESQCRAFQSGTTFELSEHYRADLNGAYALLEVHHHCVTEGYRSWETGVEYRNEFTAIPADVVYRPPFRTRKPVVRGSQTALVVGKAGEEIWTDKYGRVKVQFYWDREGKKNEESSCWIRVSSAWAGKGWGAVQIPRVGQEVIVDFLEGDPDQPIVTGRVYNADQMPPYELPANQTQSGVKSRSTQQGSTDTFNELRFEDKKGAEEVLLHAERNLQTTVEADESRSVGHDRTVFIQHLDKKQIKDGGRSTEIEKGFYDIGIKEGDYDVVTEKGDQSLMVREGNHSIWVEKGDQEIKLEKGDQSIVVIDGNQTIFVGGNQETEITDGKQTITVTDGNQTVSIEKGNQETKLGQGNLVVKVDMGKITYEAMQGIELKVGQNSIKIDQSGITIKGLNVKVEGQIQTEIKGTMAEINGSAMLQVKGGIVMIN